jgi:hypothetical protein
MGMTMRWGGDMNRLDDELGIDRPVLIFEGKDDYKYSTSSSYAF